jgi:hypothetical protein
MRVLLIALLSLSFALSSTSQQISHSNLYHFLNITGFWRMDGLDSNGDTKVITFDCREPDTVFVRYFTFQHKSNKERDDGRVTYRLSTYCPDTTCLNWKGGTGFYLISINSSNISLPSIFKIESFEGKIEYKKLYLYNLKGSNPCNLSIYRPEYLKYD